MADTLTASEAKAFLNEDLTPVNPPSTQETNRNVADLAASGKNLTVSPLNRATLSASGGDAGYIARNQVGDIPLDIESGAPPWVRFNLSFKREKDNQVKYLQDKYGEGAVRQDAHGDLIVRMMDTATGKPKDVLVDERNMSAKDFLDLAGVIPEIAGGILAMRAGQGSKAIGPLKGIAGGVRDAVTSALGAETAGVAKDVVADLSAGQPDLPSQFLDILKDRSQMAVGDAVIGGAAQPIGAFINFMRAPLHGARTAVQFDLLGAQKYFKDKYGIEIPVSVGESTGSPLFSRTEAFVEKLPGGSGPIRELKAQQEDQLRKLQQIIMGSPRTDEEVGNQAIQALRSKGIGQAVSEVQTSKDALAGSATTSIDDAVNAATGTKAPEWMNMDEVGATVRGKVTSLRDAAKAESDALYGRVRELGGENRILPTTNLSTEASNILAKLPKKETISETASPILDEFGNAIKQTTEGLDVMREFVPPNVLARLEALSTLKGQSISLTELQQMRREVYDDIAKGQAVPGLGTHYLSKIGKALTGAIEEGVESLPSGELKTALSQANAHYKGKVLPFNRTGVSELFREPEQAGFLGDTELVKRYFQGPKAPENLKVLKETLGESSPEFAKVKRVAADSVVETSRDLATGLYDAGTLMSNLRLFVDANPKIAQEIFGDNVRRIASETGMLKFAQGAKLDQNQLEALLSSRSGTADKLRSFLDAQKQKDILYKNSILKGVASGEVGAETIKPSEFVNRFVDRAEPAEVRQVLGMLADSPETIEAIRQKTVEKLFRDAARPAQAADINKLLGGEKTQLMSGTGIFEQLKNPTQREKLVSILGKDTFEDVLEYMKIEAGREAKEQSFKSAGGIAAGAQIAGMMKGGDLAYLAGATKNFVAAKMLTSKAIRSWLANVPKEDGATALTATILGSPVFLQAVTDTYGDKSSGVMKEIKSSLDRSATNRANQPKNQKEAIEKFLRE